MGRLILTFAAGTVQSWFVPALPPCYSEAVATFKTIAALGLALFIALGSAGCGEKADDPNTVHLVAWKFNNPGLWRRLADQFERQHPPLKVALEIGPHSSTNYHDLLTPKAQEPLQRSGRLSDGRNLAAGVRRRGLGPALG